LLYSLFLAVAAAGLAIHFMLSEDTTYIGKAIVIATLLAGLLIPLLRPSLSLLGIGVQLALAIFLVLHGRFHVTR